jgi:hypothetical protein
VVADWVGYLRVRGRILLVPIGDHERSTNDLGGNRASQAVARPSGAEQPMGRSVRRSFRSPGRHSNTCRVSLTRHPAVATATGQDQQFGSRRIAVAITRSVIVWTTRSNRHVGSAQKCAGHAGIGLHVHAAFVVRVDDRAESRLWSFVKPS